MTSSETARIRAPYLPFSRMFSKTLKKRQNILQERAKKAEKHQNILQEAAKKTKKNLKTSKKNKKAQIRTGHRTFFSHPNMARGTRKKTKRCTPTDAHTHAQLPSANGNHSKTQGPTQHTPGPQIRVKKHHFAMETTQKTPKKHPEIPQRGTPMEGEWNELIRKIAQIQPRAG